MDLDPRLRPGSDDASPDGAESAPLGHKASEYPEPPSQFAARQQQQPPASASTSPNFYGTRPQTQSAHASYQRESSSSLRASPRLDQTDPIDPYSDLKRPRACEACRQLKVRCEPDLANPNGSCKRCAKAGRSCVVTVPTRKRQKKTDSRVAELERKIDALTASLQASQGRDALPPPSNAPPPREEQVGRRWLGSGQSSSTRAVPSAPPSSQAGSKRRHSGEVKETRDTGLLSQMYPRHPSPASEPPVDTMGKQWRTVWSGATPGAKEAVAPAPDIIDRGLVSITVALEAFTRFVDAMSCYIPLVVFPPGTQMSEVRKSRPVLFHAIIAVAVGPFQPTAQMPLLHELYKTIADRVIVKGEKSLDLVQALLVSCTFYTPPDNFEEIKFYQLAQLAVTVGMDIGMYRRSPSKTKPLSLLREIMKHSPASDPDSPEVRRTWLGCYFLSTQVSTALRRPILVRWHPYMDECITILEKSPDALPSDKAMVQWAKLVRIIEEISLQFFADDLGSVPSFSEPKHQFTLKAFEKQLEQWKKETYSNCNSIVMAQAEAIVSIYLHENSMNMDVSDDQKTPGEDISNPTTAARVSALSATLTAIHQAIDTICSLDIKDLVNVPTISLARTSFAVVALIKLYSIVTAPESYLGQVIDPSNLKVETYLDKVIAHYTAAGELPGAVTPAKFSTVLSMLREWFKTRKDQHLALKEAFHGSWKPGNIESCPHLDRTQTQNTNKAGQTPLHLLSEVAMGEPKSQSSPSQPHHQQQPPYPPRSGFPTAEPISQPSSDLVVSQNLGPGPAPTPCPAAAAVASTSTAPSSEPWVQYASQRQFYPSPFSSNQPALPGYADPGGMLPAAVGAQGILVPELGIQVGYDPENLFALGNMLGDGVFNLPLPTDGGMGFF